MSDLQLLNSRLNLIRPLGRAGPLSGRWAKALSLGTLTGGMLIASFASASASAAPTSMVDLGQASTYAVLSGASVGNTVSADGAPHTTLRGDLGVKANTQPTGFPPGVVTGATRVGATARSGARRSRCRLRRDRRSDRRRAVAAALAGRIITPGLYAIAGAASNTTTVTLDGGGNPNAVFVFQVNGAMAFAAGSHVVLTNGARHPGSSGRSTAPEQSAPMPLRRNADRDGRGQRRRQQRRQRPRLRSQRRPLARQQPVLQLPARDHVAGGTTATPPTRRRRSAAPPTSRRRGWSRDDRRADPHRDPLGGTWSITSAILANGTYPVVASVTDGAGNTGNATQQLTVDTVLPVVTLDGGWL